MNTDTPPTITSGSHHAHARFAPSDSHRWSTCTAAIAFQEANAHRVPKEKDSPHAIEGTEAHDWATKLLTGAIKPNDIPENFREHVVRYAEHCLSYVPEGVTPMVEVEVPLYYQPTATGTCDFAVVTNDRVVIRDLKYGAGVLVEADENTQLAIYAMSLIAMLDDPDIYPFHDDTIIDIGIFQPRHREAHEARPWVITLGELRKFCWDLEHHFITASTGLERVRAKLTHRLTERRDIACDEILEAAPMLSFTPDDHACRWCKVKSFCDRRFDLHAEGLSLPDLDGRDLIAAMPDLTKEEKKLPVDERLAVRFEKVGVPRSALTDDYLVRLYSAKKWIEDCLSDVEEHLQAKADSGTPAPGTKLVAGREGNRKWTDEAAADTFLKGRGLNQDERYEKKLISPTEAEKILKDVLKQSKRTATRFEQLVGRSPAKNVLALDTDKREAVASSLTEGLVDEEVIDI